jgi:hypothetical protein
MMRRDLMHVVCVINHSRVEVVGKNMKKFMSGSIMLVMMFLKVVTSVNKEINNYFICHYILIESDE